MKLNAWGQLIQAIGELPADNDVPRTPVPKPGRTNADRAQYARTRAVNAEHRARQWRDRAEKLQAQLDTGRTYDHGEINIPFHKRASATERTITKAAELQYAIDQTEHSEARAHAWRLIEQEHAE